MISVCPFLCTCDGENSVQVLGKVRLIGLCLVAVTVEGKTLRLAVVDVIVQCNDHLLEFFVICFFVVCSKGIQICHTKDVFQHLAVCDQTISFDVVWDSIVSLTLKLKFQCIRHGHCDRCCSGKQTHAECLYGSFHLPSSFCALFSVS